MQSVRHGCELKMNPTAIEKPNGYVEFSELSVGEFFELT